MHGHSKIVVEMTAHIIHNSSDMSSISVNVYLVILRVHANILIGTAILFFSHLSIWARYCILMWFYYYCCKHM